MIESNLDKFAEKLLKKHIIWRPLLTKAMIRLEQINKNTPRALAKILTDEFNIDHDKVYSNLADLYAFRTYSLDTEKITKEEKDKIEKILDKFPKDFKKKLFYHKIVPFKFVDEDLNTLIVLSADPTDKIAKEIIDFDGFQKIEIMYCPQKPLSSLIKLLSSEENEFLKLLEESEEDEIDVQIAKPVIDDNELTDKLTKSKLVNLFEAALVDAVRKGASDIHIIPFGKSAVDIFFRIDGKLQLWDREENVPGEALSAVVKDRTVGIDRFEREIDQDGFAQRTIDDNIIRFRISIIPIISSEYSRKFESIVIRVIDDRNVITDFRKLGFQKKAEEDFFKSINTTSGIVIVTGPTGSGKSTTLMAALHYVIDPTKNVLTCEDPVEYVINGARQIKISQKMTFERAVRSILRHDPDVVMVGEIRDKITAEIAIKLANTGHLTLATLHTNDAPSAITRLYKLGIETFLLAYSINIIIAQRLVRKLCPYCKQKLPENKWKAAIEFGIDVADLKEGKIYDAVGCDKCHNGYKGRINIAEALYFYPDIANEIMQAGEVIDEHKIRELAEKHGMLSMRESGLFRIREGLTTISEIAYATSEDK